MHLQLHNEPRRYDSHCSLQLYVHDAPFSLNATTKPKNVNGYAVVAEATMQSLLHHFFDLAVENQTERRGGRTPCVPPRPSKPSALSVQLEAGFTGRDRLARGRVDL